MDWHKLQHKLFEMDPVDPRAELERLRKVAQTPTPLEEPDLIKESFEIKPGSMPLGIDSISDFAALAGIRLDEKQLKGPAGQAKGSDPMPTTKPGRTKHPLKDKLVGEADFKSAFQRGYKNYNNLGAFGKLDGAGSGNIASTTTKSTTTDVSGSVDQLARLLQMNNVQKFSAALVSAAQGNLLSSSDKQILGEAFERILGLPEARKRDVFRIVLSLDARSFSQPTATNNNVLSRQSTQPPTANPTPPTQRSKKKVTSSKEFDNSKTTIKEQLLKLLEEKKLK